MPRERGEGNKFDRALAGLDLGYKVVRDGKLYLAQESNTIMGFVQFSVDGTIITCPDGTQFDLEHMQYSGEQGIYPYLKKVSGTGEVRSWDTRLKA